MLLLTTTSTRLQLVTGSAGDIEVNWSGADNLAGAITPVGDVPANVTTATTTDNIVPAPAASTQRNVKAFSAFNNHATNSNAIKIQITDGTDTAVLWGGTLLAQEWVTLDESGAWLHFDANGGIYPAVLPVATQAEQEAGTSLVKTVTPGTQHFHPSAAKFWAKVQVNGTTDAAYNVSSITDSGAGVMVVNIATDFSSAHYAASVSVENLDASIDAAADGQVAMFGLAGQAAGSIQCLCKNEAGTAAADPTRWHVIGFGDHA